MQLTYDPRHNIAYLRLQEKVAQVETIRVSEELHIDLAPAGTVYGIELLNANQQLHAEDQGNWSLSTRPLETARKSTSPDSVQGDGGDGRGRYVSSSSK